MKKVILISSDPALIADFRDACKRRHLQLSVEPTWERALKVAAGTNLIITDLLAVLSQPHRISGYVNFAEAKMKSKAVDVPTALIGVPDNYRMDGMVGWPGFLAAFVPRPVDEDSLEYLLDHA